MAANHQESNEPHQNSDQPEQDDMPQLTAEDIEEIDDNQDEGDAPMDSDGEDNEQDGGDDDDKMVINDSSIAAFFSHKGNSIFTISLHPQFPTVPLAISGGADDGAFLWSLPEGNEVQALQPKHTDSVISVGWSADGQFVATGGMDGMVNVWKVAEQGQWNKWDHVVTLEGGDEVQFITWHPKGHVLVAGYADSTTWMWNLPSGSVMQVFSGHEDAVTCGAFTPDGRKLLTTSTDGSLLIYDPRQNAALSRLGSGDSRFYSDGGFISLDISPDSKLVAVGSVVGETRLVSLSQIDSDGGMSVITSLSGHKSGESIEGVKFLDLLGRSDSQASHLISIGTDGKAIVWDIQSQKVRVECVHYDEHVQDSGALTKLIIHNNGPLFTTASSTGTLRTWDARNGAVVAKHEGFTDGVLDADVKSDGQGGWVVVGAGDEGHALVFRA
ncbi:unnamed protein product [Sympodiomycopsis kandeliae]